MPAVTVSEKKEVLRYSLLPNADWHRLVPIFEELDWFLPPPYLAIASVAENEAGEIVGFQILQLVMHAEPTWIRNDYSGRVDYLRMWGLIQNLPKIEGLVTPGYLLLAPDEKTEKMAELGGFTKIPGSLWRKEWHR